MNNDNVSSQVYHLKMEVKKIMFNYKRVNSVRG